MSLVRPFPASLPLRELAAEVAMPPVAAVTADQWQRLTQEKPNSFLHVIRSAIDSAGGGQPPDEAGPSGRARFDAMVADGVFRSFETPGYFVYRLSGDGYSKTGIVAEVATRGLADGRVKRHENTRRETEDLIAGHLSEVRLSANPVALTYSAHDRINHLVDKVTAGDAYIDFVADDGIQQTIWTVDEPSLLAAIHEALSGVEALYITDGHHRCAAAARFAEEFGDSDAHFVGVLFPDDQVRVTEYNRCVSSLTGTVDEFLTQLATSVEVEELHVAWADDARPKRKGTVGMALAGRWYRLTLPDADDGDAVANLDVSRLQDVVLGPLLGIDDPRTDQRLMYLPGSAGLGELERHDAAVCFALHPTTPSEVMAVADAGRVMPPKSTWFEPKVLGGLIVRVFE